MDKIYAAFEYVLRWEGGLVDDKDDPGGLTNYGISYRWLSHYFESQDSKNFSHSAEDIRHIIINLTKDQAIQYLKSGFWNSRYDKIEQARLLCYILDMAVNIGPAMAHKLLQRSFWAFTGNQLLLKDDGAFGDITLCYTNQYGLSILPVLRAERAGYYRMLVAEDHKYEKFLEGWLKRTYS